MKFFIFILLTINAFGLEFELLTRIQIPSDIIIDNLNKTRQSFSVGRNGDFAWNCPHAKGEFTIFVRTNLQYFYLRKTGLHTQNTQTNYISSSIENGKLYIYQDEITISENRKFDSDFTLKTITPKTTYILETLSTGRSIQKVRISQTSKEIISTSSDYITIKQIVKYNESSIPIATNKISQNIILSTHDNYWQNSENNISRLILASELKDGFVYFYKFTDSDLLSSPNRITLGSSQNGSLTATVNNPEQALLNIQSSTNLIDWNTFKTIQNEPTLEIIVPANKSKEFIRAIE
jgi:hypothetical protein